MFGDKRSNYSVYIPGRNNNAILSEYAGNNEASCMARHRGPDPITTRQGEKLIELRDDLEYHSSVKGFSVVSLITNCWLARDDLNSEQDRKFIEDLKASGVSAIKRRQLWKLLVCARELSEVEKYVAIEA
jgi:hypothetical protein